MPNTKSAAKHMRHSEARKLINRPNKSRMRNAVKAARTAIAAKPATAAELVAKAISSLDRAVTKKVLHKNAAARRKSRLMRAIAKAVAA